MAAPWMPWPASIARETLVADGADFRKSQKGKALQEAYWAHARRRTARRRAHRGAAPTEARAPARGAAMAASTPTCL